MNQSAKPLTFVQRAATGLVRALQPVLHKMFDSHKNNEIPPLVLVLCALQICLIYYNICFIFVGVIIIYISKFDKVKKTQAMYLLIGSLLVMYRFTLLGSVLILLSIAIQFVLTFLTGARADPTKHVYSPGKHYRNGILCGELIYIGHLAVIKYHSNDPYYNGQTQGIFFAETTKQLKSNLDFLSFATRPFGVFNSIMKTKNVYEKLQSITPEYIWNDMLGFVDAYNEYFQKKGITFKRLTIHDIFDIQLMANSKNFVPQKIEDQLKVNLSVACTAILKGDFLGRNVEWGGLGTGGEKSALMVWMDDKVASFNPPSIFGGITAWNQAGLIATINVCPGEIKEIYGPPTILFIRDLLKNCRTIADVRRKYTSEGKEGFKRPLGPCHLTIAKIKNDVPESNIIISYYQGIDGSDYIREQKEKASLTAFNWCEPEQIGGYFNSEQRSAWLHNFESESKDMNDEDFIHHTLSSSHLFNCWMTIHNFIFDLKNGTVKIRNNNGFAASNSIFHQISLREVFD